MTRTLLVLLSLCLSAFLLADGPPPHAKREPEPDPLGMNEPDQREHILRMAKLYKVAPELIEKMRLSGIGIGEIDVVVDMAKAAKKEPEDVIALRKKGTSWTKIAEEYKLKLEDIVKDEDARTALIQGEKNLLKQLAERFKLTEEQVAILRARVSDWGELRLALLMAEKAKVPVETLIAQAEAGHGWGTIGKELGLHIGNLMRDPGSTENFGGPPTPHPKPEKKPEAKDQ